MSFGSRLKIARKNAELTQAQIAAALSVKSSAISNYEKDLSKPCIERFYKLCELLKVSPNWMLEWDGADIEFVKKYNALDNDGREAVAVILDQQHKRVLKVFENKVAV